MYIFGGDGVAKLSVIQPIELLRVPVGRRGQLGRPGFRDLAHGAPDAPAHQTVIQNWLASSNEPFKGGKKGWHFSEQILGDFSPEIFQYREAVQISTKNLLAEKWESHKKIQGLYIKENEKTLGGGNLFALEWARKYEKDSAAIQNFFGQSLCLETSVLLAGLVHTLTLKDSNSTSMDWGGGGENWCSVWHVCGEF